MRDLIIIRILNCTLVSEVNEHKTNMFQACSIILHNSQFLLMVVHRCPGNNANMDGCIAPNWHVHNFITILPSTYNT